VFGDPARSGFTAQRGADMEEKIVYQREHVMPRPGDVGVSPFDQRK